MTGRPGRCWYCGLAVLEAGDPPEHVVPAALGAELTTDRVCAGCNTRAGVEIDQPFLSDWLVGMNRRLWDIRDSRRAGDRPPPRPPEELTLRDGTPVRVRDEGVEVVPSVDRDDIEARIRAGSDAEIAEMVRKVEDRLAREGKTLTKASEVRSVSNEVDGKFEIDGTLWLRMSTKIAIAAASLVLEEGWLDTAQAVDYRGFLWEQNPTFGRGTPAVAFPAAPGEDVGRMVSPPEHLLYFTPDATTTSFQGVLFGSLATPAFPFDVSGDAPDSAWLLNPLTRSVAPLTFDELLEISARRMESEEKE